MRKKSCLLLVNLVIILGVCVLLPSNKLYKAESANTPVSVTIQSSDLGVENDDTPTTAQGNNQTSHKNKSKFPQTNEKKELLLMVIGMLLVVMVILLIWIKKERRENEKI